MSEKENNTPENTGEEIKQIRLKRHLWPDEQAVVEAEKTAKRLKIILICAVIVFFLGGWLLGSFFPVPGTNAGRTELQAGQEMDSSEKISEMMSVLENDWYFGKDIEDLQLRLTDQALVGMSSNEEDPHTEYMTAEEVSSFTESINRNFVGIGVQYVNTAGINLITKVFRDTPAYKAGVLAGDIITSVDGVSVEGWESSALKEAITGEEGTEVKVGITRQGEEMVISIIRGEVSATSYGYIMDNGIGFLEMYQFGGGTAAEVDTYLDYFEENGVTKMILDLRGNTGGYLSTLGEIAARFLPGDTVYIRREFTNGATEASKTVSGETREIGPIVILVDGDTASAAEALTIALMEQREDVTVIGETTYGKGTAQVTRSFTDGSAVKYTTSRWLSPNGVWINDTGIEPDIPVAYPEAVARVYGGVDEGVTYGVDTVSVSTADLQIALKYLGYEVDRTDGYFSVQTETALKQFETDYDLEADGVLDHDTYEAVYSAMYLNWVTTDEHDTQVAKAVEVLNG